MSGDYANNKNMLVVLIHFLYGDIGIDSSISGSVRFYMRNSTLKNEISVINYPHVVPRLID